MHHQCVLATKKKLKRVGFLNSESLNFLFHYEYEIASSVINYLLTATKHRPIYYVTTVEEKWDLAVAVGAESGSATGGRRKGGVRLT